MKKLTHSLASSVAVLAAALCLHSCGSEGLTLQVSTQNGIVEGFDQNGVKTFLGIPFAQPPVGELRWQAPQPASSWEGIREAKAFSADPMQPDIYGDMCFRGSSRSEDCLYLNVWTTAEHADDAMPVLIYFYGGGLMAGSGSEPRYDGAAMAKEGVVCVTSNYRLGVFGFFSHPELTAESPYGGSGNYGFLDQVAAINWVKNNIAAFGGNPDKITIVGESAGSFSVSVLMASPLSKNLIAGAMLSSGAELGPNQAKTQADAESEGKMLLESKGVMSIADARAIGSDDFQAMFPPTGMSNVVLDGYFMEENPDAVFSKGEQSDVPLLAGWNSQEGTPAQYLMGMEPTIENFRKAVSTIFGDMTDEILEAYGMTSDEVLFTEKALTLPSDLFTGFCTWKACDYQAKTTDKPVFRYKFNRPRPEVSAAMGEKVGALAGGVREKTEEEKQMEADAASKPQFVQGAVHSADIEYAMGNLSTNIYYEWKDEDYALSKLFLTYYANFCKNGNPNGEGLPQWTPINGKLDSAPVMQLNVESCEAADPELENAYRTLDRFYSKQFPN